MGVNIRGAGHDMVVKLRVADAINNAERDSNLKTSGEININQIAKAVGVSWGFVNKVNKVREELEVHKTLTKM